MPSRRTAEVTVYVQAYDNKNPVFAPPWSMANPKIEITIAEEPPIELELITLIAKDPISGRNINNFVEVEGSDPGNYVSISPQSGKVWSIFYRFLKGNWSSFFHVHT